MPIILASASPRRRDLLRTAAIAVSAIRPADIPEDPLPGEEPVQYARRLAADKAAAVDDGTAWVLAADTVVHADGEIFGKPADDADATRILDALAGRWHSVTTAWCLRRGPKLRFLDHATTAVRFRSLTGPEIAAYVASGEGRDKAGGYGAQGLGAALVEEVRGSYSNVVGLPLEDVMSALRSVGIGPGAR